MVGARGFEPPTPGPPDQCANQAALRPDAFYNIRHIQSVLCKRFHRLNGYVWVRSKEIEGRQQIITDAAVSHFFYLRLRALLGCVHLCSGYPEFL